VVAFTPSAESDVALDTVPSVTFSGALDPATVGQTGVSVLADGAPVAATLELSHDDETVSLLVDGGLTAGTEYTIAVEPSVASLDGHELSEAFTFAFRTVDGLDPVGRPGPGGDDGDGGTDGGTGDGDEGPADTDGDGLSDDEEPGIGT